MRRGALLATLLLGACSADGGLHEALYRIGNPAGGRMGMGAMALLAPWQVHSPVSCAKLSTPGASLGLRDNYATLVDLCRRNDTFTVASR